MYKIMGSIFILLILASQQSIAVDESVYYGKWEGAVCNTALSLVLSRKSVVVEMKGGEKIQDVKYEYVYSNLSPYPFLSVMFTDNNKIEHLLYVVIGSDSKDKKGRLTGFYEKSKIIEDSHGKLEAASERIELIRPENLK